MTSAVFSAPIDLLRKGALEYFDADRVSIEPLDEKEGRYSWILRVRIEPAGKPPLFAFLKRYKVRENAGETTAGIRKQLVAEFDVLRQKREALAGYPGLTVVRPIACFPEEFALITEQAPGSTLRSVFNQRTLWWRPIQARQMIAILERVGLWVKAFQTTTPAGDHFSLDDMREYVDQRLRLLVRGGRFSEAQRESLLSHFNALAAKIHERELAAVAIHADFCPPNVLASDTTITVLDISSSGTGSRYYDLAHSFMHMENFKVRPWMGDRVVREGQLAMLRAFDPQLSPDNPLFELELMRHIVCQFAQELEEATPRWIHRVYSSMVWQRNRRRVWRWAGIRVG